MPNRVTERRAPLSKKSRSSQQPAGKTPSTDSAGTRNKKVAPLDETFVWIGGQIRSLRKSRKLSLDAVSSACDVSIGYLSQIERGLAKPSIGFLKKVSMTLDVPIGWFFPDAAPSDLTDRGVVVRASQRRQLTSTALVSDYLLSANLDNQLKLFYSVLEPGANSGESYSHQGEEGGYVLSGRLDLWVGAEHFTIYAGDSFSYLSTIPHRYANVSNEPTTIIWAVASTMKR